MEIAYCRREINEKLCSKPLSITGRNNPLNWCDSCRERLPLWPGDTARCLCGHSHDNDVCADCSCRIFVKHFAQDDPRPVAIIAECFAEEVTTMLSGQQDLFA